LNLANRNFDEKKECAGLSKPECKDLKDKECLNSEKKAECLSEKKEETGFFENAKNLIVEGASKAGELINTAVEKTKDFFEVGKEEDSTLKKDEIKDRDLQEKAEIKEPIINENKNYHKSLPKDQHIHNQNYYSDLRGENLNKIKSTGDDQKIREQFTEGNTNFVQPKQEEKLDDKELPKTGFNSGFNDEFKQNLNLNSDKKLDTLDSSKNFEKNNENKEISVTDNSNHIQAGDGVAKGSNFNKDFNNEANLNKELHQIQDSNLPLNELTSPTNLVNATSADINQKKEDNIIGLGTNQNKTITH